MVHDGKEVTAKVEGKLVHRDEPFLWQGRRWRIIDCSETYIWIGRYTGNTRERPQGEPGPAIQREMTMVTLDISKEIPELVFSGWSWR